MVSIRFEQINEDNESMVRSVKLKLGQRGFIESVEECLEEAKEVEEWRPVAIYNNMDLVGFAMYGSFGPNRDTWIDRIIIDQHHQGNGIGKAAMVLLMEKVLNEYKIDRLYLSIVDGNEIALNLYTHLGFKYINEKDPNREEILMYKKPEN